MFHFQQKAVFNLNPYQQASLERCSTNKIPRVLNDDIVQGGMGFAHQRQFLEQKNHLNDSYTQYKNKVGLTIGELDPSVWTFVFIENRQWEPNLAAQTKIAQEKLKSEFGKDSWKILKLSNEARKNHQDWVHEQSIPCFQVSLVF